MADVPAAAAAAAALPGITSWQRLATSATPTLIACILASVGALLAHKRVADAPACQLLAKLSFFVFTPALTFSKLTQAVSISSIVQLWPLLANMTISIVVGLAVGLAVSRVLRTPPEFRTHALVAVAFGNVGNLPLVFVPTLCHEEGAIFRRALGDDCERLGMAYTAFDIAAATLWQFTLGVHLFRRRAAAAALAAGAADPPGTPTPASDEDGPALPGELLPTSACLQKYPTVSDLLAGRHGSQPGSGSSTPRGAESPLVPRQRLGSAPLHPDQLLPASLHSSQQQQGGGSLVVELQPVGPGPPPGWQQLPQQRQQQAWRRGSSTASEIEEDSAALLDKGAAGRNVVTAAAGTGRSSVRQAVRAARQYLRAVDWGAAFPLPSQAAILGVAVGCLPAAKALLYGPRAPLRVLSEALDTLGGGLIPVSLPLLGAILYRGPGASRLPARVTVGVLLTRLVLQPLLLTGLVVGALALCVFRPPDALFLLTLLLSNATPTAINMQTFAVLYQVGEAEMSSILFFQYIGAVLTLPAFVSLFLRIIDVWL